MEEIKSVAKAISVLRTNGYNVMKIWRYYVVKDKEGNCILDNISYPALVEFANKVYLEQKERWKIIAEDYIKNFKEKN